MNNICATVKKKLYECEIRSDRERQCMIPFICRSKKPKQTNKNLIDTENKLVVARGREWVKWMKMVEKYRLPVIK